LKKEEFMDVTQEVILDLLPVYLAGEASPSTRALVEAYLKQDPELAQRIRLQWAENLEKAVPSALPPELELKSLRRARSLIAWQRWLFGFGIFFTAFALSNQMSFENGHMTQFHFLLSDYPAQIGACVLLAVCCWTTYLLIRRRLRTTAL
jgi:hypothetical protein